MAKRKKEPKEYMPTTGTIKTGMSVQLDCGEVLNVGQGGSDVDDKVETKANGSDAEGCIAAPDFGSTPNLIMKKVVSNRPALNTPFLRSSVKRKTKEPSPPPPSSKPETPEKTEVKPDRKRCWEAWSDGETTLFFEAVSEHGKDFDAIQKYIEQRHKKLGLAAHQIKNKNQVRHLYYRTCHKLFSFIDPKPDQEKTASELLALVNFGELRKKLSLKGGITRRVGQRLNQLVNSGQTVIRVRGMNRRVKTPLCKTLRKITGDENKSDPYKLPAHVVLELHPKNNNTWALVQGAAHNPRVRLVVSLKRNLGSIIRFLNEKWTPHCTKLLNTLKPAATNQDTLRLRLVLGEGEEITPHRQLTGRYMHSDSRAVFSLESESRVTKAALALKTAKLQRGASARPAPSGSSLDCTKDVPGLQQPKDVKDAAGKPQRKYRPRKKVKLTAKEGVGEEMDTPTDDGGTVIASVRVCRKSEGSEMADLTAKGSSERSNAADIETGDLQGVSVEEATFPMEVTWTEKETTKDELLLGLLSAENAKNLTMTDIYIMLNMPTRFKFEYEFVDMGDDSGKKRRTNSNLLSKLYELARTEFTDIKKPKRSVSVGTVTSPQRFTNLPGNNSSPMSKASFISQLSRSPSTSRAHRGALTNGLAQSGSRPAAKAGSGGKEKDGGVFLAPAAPSPQASRLSAESSTATAAADKLLMAQIKSVQIQNKKGRKPLVVQRRLLPRLQSEHTGPTREMMSMSKTGQFTPVQLAIPDSVKQRSLIRPVPILPGPPDSSPSIGQSGTCNTMMVSGGDSYSPSSSQAAAAAVTASLPASCLAVGSPTAILHGDTTLMNEIEAASAAAGIDTTLRYCPSPVHLPPSAQEHSLLPRHAMLNPSPQTVDGTVEIVSVTSSSDDDCNVRPYRISPPNLSSLMEISLPSSAAVGCGGDAAIDMPIGATSFTAFSPQLSPTASNSTLMLPSMSPVRDSSGSTTPPLNMSTLSSSPFKLSSLGVDNQWLNGESADMSLSSILANLESPEKKERQSIINMSSSSSSCLLNVATVNESSRDSTISKDVDTHLQYMMNENSIDYIAKFADLAAHIAAQQESQKETTVQN